MSITVDDTGTRLTLDLWHPNCWAIETTDRVGGGILGHAIYHSPRATDEAVTGMFTAYGDNDAEVQRLLDEVRASPLAGPVHELRERFDGEYGPVPGTVAREFFLEYDPRDMVCPVLLEHGFVHAAPVRIENGREFWQVYFTGNRCDVEEHLDAVREAASAEVSVSRITSAERTPPRNSGSADVLTPAQREVFDLARERGYYQWPRGVSTRELAAAAGLSKSTLLEHLRKAEAKLLDPPE
ncbi:transcriptional regulator [Haloprofundus marisrubri]|uniref:Transcriptional regulator n=1 Tax=Haloprofundus marisrubri TaxID=1514971 RepID=A0A0W1RA11_9EURY|nr:helix-turn-helix domain-containing protein [Haloprofundus marisrubri]KTG10187.1 transcriptional regulator [Haloprofundus marisrubri]